MHFVSVSEVRQQREQRHCVSRRSSAGKYDLFSHTDNYSRSAQRGENGAAQLAVYDFVVNAVKLIYLLNKKYCPFYKWAFRGMRELTVLSELEQPLVYLLETPNDKESVICKEGIIEDVAGMAINELKKQKLSDALCNNLDTHAFSVTDKIEDAELRNANIFLGE